MGYVMSVAFLVSGVIKTIYSDVSFAGVYLITSALFFIGQYIGDSIRKETDNAGKRDHYDAPQD